MLSLMLSLIHKVENVTGNLHTHAKSSSQPVGNVADTEFLKLALTPLWTVTVAGTNGPSSLPLGISCQMCITFWFGQVLKNPSDCAEFCCASVCIIGVDWVTLARAEGICDLLWNGSIGLAKDGTLKAVGVVNACSSGCWTAWHPETRGVQKVGLARHSPGNTCNELVLFGEAARLVLCWLGVLETELVLVW